MPVRTATDRLGPAENFQIGVAFYGGTSYYTGNLAELAVWDRALTANEARDYALSGVVSTARLAADISLEVAAARYTLFSANAYVGEANLASWRCMNVPKNYRAEVRLRDGVVEAVVGPQGLTLFLR